MIVFHLPGTLLGSRPLTNEPIGFDRNSDPYTPGLPSLWHHVLTLAERLTNSLTTQTKLTVLPFKETGLKESKRQPLDVYACLYIGCTHVCRCMCMFVWIHMESGGQRPSGVVLTFFTAQSFIGLASLIRLDRLSNKPRYHSVSTSPVL